MWKVVTYPFTDHYLSASVRGWTDCSECDTPACLHDSVAIPGMSWPTSNDVQVNFINLNSSSQSCLNQSQGSDGRPHNESLQPPSEGASPTSPGKKPGRPSYQCTVCCTRYTQKQVLRRHYREKHLPASICLEHNCDYKWTRSRQFEYRRHLRNKHGLEDDKIDKKLGRPAKRHLGEGRVIESNLSSHLSPPLIEHDRQSPAGPRQRQLARPSIAERRDASHASPPIIPSVAYNPQFGHAEPDVTTTEEEDSSGLKHLASVPSPAFLSEEQSAILVRLLDIHCGIRIPTVSPGETTTADIAGMPYMSALPSPCGGHHTSPASGNPPPPPPTDGAATLTDTSSWRGELGI